MKGWIAYAVLACGLAVLIFVIVFGRDLIELVNFVKDDDTTERIQDAKHYMDSLTDKDIQSWIQRTKRYFEHPTDLNFDATNLPPDLQRLGITGIEAGSDQIDYVWLGGMDDTALDVVRMANGNFQVIAVYTPYSSKILWPRRVTPF